MTQHPTLFCLADDTEKAQLALSNLRSHYPFTDNIHEAEIIIALGGDGFMLHTLHEAMKLNIPIYGMNCGTVGFLMNDFNEEDLFEIIARSVSYKLHPLKMTVTTTSGAVCEALAINEVSLLRQTKQAAHVRITVDGRTRIEEMVCDGVLLCTSAGSTAYNLSAHGPILPLGSNLLALTPISPFRPRRWRGALLSRSSSVKFDVHNHEKRPVSAVADFTEFRNVLSVDIHEEKEQTVTLLFDSNHSLEERITAEQFIV